MHTLQKVPPETNDYCCNRAMPGVKGPKNKQAYRDRIWDWVCSSRKKGRKWQSLGVIKMGERIKIFHEKVSRCEATSPF